MAKKVLIGPEIRILEPINRFEIIKIVINTFIDFEKDKKGKEVEFRYPVEILSNNEKLYIRRPGIKWDFDFKVEIPLSCELGEGRHDQIASFLIKLKKENEEIFNKLWVIIENLYKCVNNDVDQMLLDFSLTYNYVDVLSKVIKWLFIMEDIIYWHYEGRAFLYNFIYYTLNEKDETCRENILKKGRKMKPETIKKLLRKLNMDWVLP